MKKLFLLTFLLLSLVAYSQDSEPIDLSIKLDDFIGTWRYDNPETEEVFIIKLREPVSFFCDYDKEYAPIILGSYYYSKEGVVISDNLNVLNEFVPETIYSLDDLPHAIIIYPFDDQQNELAFAFRDQTAYAESFWTFLIVKRSGENYILKWHIRQDDILMNAITHAMDSTHRKFERFTVPTKLQLIKDLED